MSTPKVLNTSIKPQVCKNLSIIVEGGCPFTISDMHQVKAPLSTMLVQCAFERSLGIKSYLPFNRSTIPGDGNSPHWCDHGFGGLCEWLVNQVATGIVLVMAEVKHEDIRIFRRRRETHRETSTNTIIVRS